MFCVEFQGKFGLIDAAGDEVVPCKYDLIGSQGVECKPCFDFGLGPMSKKVFREGLARVKLNGKWGVIDTIGNEVVSCKYDEIYDFKEGLAEAILNGKHVLIDKTGKEIRTFDYSEPDIVLYKLGITRVEFNGKRCWIGINGLPITPDKSYKESGSDYGPYQINIPGSSIVTYKEARILGEGILGVQDILIDKWGLIDRNGKVVAPCKYDKICGLFKEGLVEVILNDRHCLIDKTGKEVTPCKYDEIGDFHADVRLPYRGG